MKQLLKRFVFPIVVATLLLGAFGIILFRHALAQIAAPDTTAVAAPHSATFISKAITEKKPFSILLLGTAGQQHEGAYLADSLIVVRIDPQQRQIALISVPRDLLIYPKASYHIGTDWKVNALYAIGVNDQDFTAKPVEYTGKNGGGRLTSAVLSDVLNVPIDRYLSIDFDGFVNVIDAVGGVKVQVEKSFTDREYPRAGHENDLCGHSQNELPGLVAQLAYKPPYEVFPCRYQTVTFTKGPMTLSGKQALAFARSRHSTEDGTDFARSARQKILIESLKKTLTSPVVLPHIQQIYQEAIRTTRTDMSADELQTLLFDLPTLRTYSSHSIPLTNSNVLKDSTSADFGYTLVPRDGTYESIGAYVNAQLTQNAIQ